MGISFIGLNHKSAPAAVRERIAFSHEKLPGALATLLSMPGVNEGVIISTCNRTEVYASLDEQVDGMSALAHFLCGYHGLDEREVMPYLYTADDLDTAAHLFNVVCSLDSLVLGEQQILGQVREAYRAACEAHATGRDLNKLFHQALRVGKGVRSETAIGQSHVSLATVAVDLVKRVFDDLEKRTVLVLGAGEMSELTTRYLSENGVESIIVANRTYEHALTLALEVDGRAMRFEDLEEGLRVADIVIASTSSPDYIVTPKMLGAIRRKRRGRSLVLMDIAMPRNVDPSCNEVEDVFVYDMDDLKSIAEKNQAGRELAAQQAAQMVGDEVRSFADWLESCDATSTIKDLRTHASQIRDVELEHLFKRLGPVESSDRKAIEAAGNALINKLLHAPTKKLEERAGTPDGESYIRLTRDLFDLDDDDSGESR